MISKLPWKDAGSPLGDNGKLAASFRQKIDDADGYIVGNIATKADKDFVMKAVNNHDGLVSALLRCRTGMQLNLLTSKNPSQDRASIRQAEEALKKAGAL